MTRIRARLTGAFLTLSALGVAISTAPQLGGYWGGI